MIKGKSLKWLHFLHITSAGIWFGATVCIGVLSAICFFALNENEFLITAPLVPKLYQKVIMPAAIFTILQGFVYGFFTSWEFFKHRWMLLKWFSILLLIACTGVGTIGHMFSVIEKVKTSGFNGGFPDGVLVLLFISMQILIMLFMIGMSVFKPKFKKTASIHKSIE